MDKMANPKVSIIIPVYNCEAYLEKCLQSVISQTYNELEIIVIDDGSTDDSAKIIKKIDDNRLICFLQENKGVSYTRNFGLSVATGKYVTFLDGDDYLSADYIENFVNIAEQNDSDVCVCGYTMVDNEENIIFQIEPHSEYIPYQHEEYAYNILGILSRFYRKEFLDLYNIRFDENREIRGEDLPVSVLTNALGKNIKCVKQSGYYYVQHNKSSRNNMQGLHNNKLPFEALESAIKIVMNSSNTNDKSFFEACIMRIFMTFLFDLGKGADKNIKKEIYLYEKRIINTYLKDVYHNKRLYIKSDLDIPFKERLNLKIFVVLMKYKLAYPLAIILN